MNNLPLQPLAWVELESTNRLICEVVTPICEYSVWKDVDSVAYSVLYYNRHTEAPTKEATGFSTIDEAKAWAWNHYNGKMQPYVKPLPTWIDISERLPEKSGRYMVVHQTTKPVKNKSTPVDIDSYDENEKSWSFFRLGIMQEVTHWMPLPELPVSKESDCE